MAPSSTWRHLSRPCLVTSPRSRPDRRPFVRLLLPSATIRNRRLLVCFIPECPPRCRKRFRQNIPCENIRSEPWRKVQLTHPYVPRSVIFLLHIALDVPMAIQGLWSPLGLPFMQLNNTTIVFIKVRCPLPSVRECTCSVCPEALRGTCRGNVRCVSSMLQPAGYVPCLLRYRLFSDAITM